MRGLFSPLAAAMTERPAAAARGIEFSYEQPAIRSVDEIGSKVSPTQADSLVERLVKARAAEILLANPALRGDGLRQSG